MSTFPLDFCCMCRFTRQRITEDFYIFFSASNIKFPNISYQRHKHRIEYLCLSPFGLQLVLMNRVFVVKFPNISLQRLKRGSESLCLGSIWWSFGVNEWGLQWSKTKLKGIRKTLLINFLCSYAHSVVFYSDIEFYLFKILCWCNACL